MGPSEGKILPIDIVSNIESRWKIVKVDLNFGVKVIQFFYKIGLKISRVDLWKDEKYPLENNLHIYNLFVQDRKSNL